MMKIKKYWLVGVLIVALCNAGCEKKEEKKSEVESNAPIKVTQGVVKEQKRVEKEVDKGSFYYSYHQEKNKSIEEDEAAYTKLGAMRHVRSPYEKVQISLLANKLSKDFLIYCSACHDDYANGIIGPSLLDKDGEYIYKQLIKFKSGDRKNVLMKQLVNRLSEDKLRALSNEIAEFNKKVQKLREENSIKDGK